MSSYEIDLKYGFKAKYNVWKNRHKLVIYYRSAFPGLRNVWSYPILAILSDYIKEKADGTKYIRLNDGIIKYICSKIHGMNYYDFNVYLEDYLLSGIMTCEDRIADIDKSGSIQYTVNKYMFPISPNTYIKKIWYSPVEDKTCAEIREVIHDLMGYANMDYRI